MMKRLLVLFTTMVLLSACVSQVVEKGVSKQLAQSRKANISDVEYSLFFDVPSQIDEPIFGRVEAKMNLEKRKDLVLDFTNVVSNVCVNGRSVGLNVENEHVVVPKSMLQEGENKVSMEFVAPNTSLNRRDDFLYTLLVPDRARTLFPCFEQPDIKAKYTLELEVPKDWEAVANGSLDDAIISESGRRRLSFRTTEPISTYLFSFVSGVFQKVPYTRGDHHINIFHRATTEAHLAQLDAIADEVFKSLEWCENYTQIDYPFEKYDLIIVPGFQYGGMEHMGATLYNDTRMFVPKAATIDQKMARSSLIAHETSHMWFGDLVTMKWFNEVWLKEVFANYYAAEIIKDWYPGLDQREAFIKYFAAAYSDDRTLGAVPVIQTLDNLNNAGLVYGNTIYNKSPIVMQMLVDMLGKENYDAGIRRYLSKFSYDNADWDDLLDALTSEMDPVALKEMNLDDWSRVWVQTQGMPTISCSVTGDSLSVSQSDPRNRNIYWPQKISFLAVGTQESSSTESATFRKNITVQMSGDNAVSQVRIPTGTRYLLPNHDMKAYGYFEIEPDHLGYYQKELLHSQDPILKHSILTNLYENVLNKRISVSDYSQILLKYVRVNSNADVLYNRSLGGLSYALNSPYASNELKIEICQVLSELEENSAAMRILISSAYGDLARAKVLDMFELPERYSKLSEPMKNTLAYHLAIYFPEKASEILKIRRKELSHPDKIKEFEFISMAVSPDALSRDAFFESLLLVENREVEPWVSSALSLLNHQCRQEEALKYIRPALEVLPEIQRTGDIFFPASWVSALLSGHHSQQAQEIVTNFIDTYPISPLLKSKVLIASDHLISQ